MHTQNIVVQALKSQQVVVLPTDTVYGLGALYGGDGYKTIYKLKQRPSTKPISLAFYSLTQLLRYITLDQQQQHHIQNTQYPSTFVISKDKFKQPCTGNTVAFRIVDDHNFVQIASCVSEPIWLTSANMHNQSPAYTYHQAQQDFPNLMGFDGGTTKHRVASQVVYLETGAICRPFESTNQ